MSCESAGSWWPEKQNDRGAPLEEQRRASRARGFWRRGLAWMRWKTACAEASLRDVTTALAPGSWASMRRVTARRRAPCVKRLVGLVHCGAPAGAPKRPICDSRGLFRESDVLALRSLGRRERQQCAEARGGITRTWLPMTCPSSSSPAPAAAVSRPALEVAAGCARVVDTAAMEAAVATGAAGTKQGWPRCLASRCRRRHGCRRGWFHRRGRA